MSEPDAWSKLETTELEQTLLEAARADRIPSELALRMAHALSSPSLAPAPASSAAGSAVAHAGLLSTKLGLWGFLSVALLAGAGAFHAFDSQPRAEASTRVAPSADAQRGATAPAAVDMPAPGAQRETNAAAAAARAGASSAASSVASAGAVPKRVESASLREEILVLDRAREALERGSAQRASSVLEEHRRRFASGALQPEAEAMRIETLVRLGDTERAQRLSRRFLGAYPSHPLCARVSALTATATAP